MKGVIIEETQKRNKECGGVITGYQEKYEKNQLFVPEQYDAILAAFRGIMIQKEISREIGKLGAELEGLVETVARYVYTNQSTFENEEPFKNWLTDVDGKRFNWEETVAYALVEMGDMEFKDFTISLLDRGAKDTLKTCKYRDPRDENWLKRHPDASLDYNNKDFSTKESIEEAFKTDITRKAQPSQISKRNLGFAK